MSESATEVRSGPSLEQILWRAMDRFAERPALVDADEFAAHVEGVFEGELPAESWAARFFEGGEKPRPANLAEAIVRATHQRLAEYQFDLQKLEYVIVEDKEKVVVVSDFGQFALQNDDLVKRAVEAAVIPGEKGARGGAGARAYLVRASGEVVAVDVKKVARSLEQLMVRQVSLPAVQKPGARLAPFGATRRSLSAAAELRALRQDPRTLQPLPATPRRPAHETSAPAARPALFLLLPDGSLARAGIGSATRWQEMLGGYLRTLQQGSVGEGAFTRSQGLTARRPVASADRFWVHPEAVYREGPALAQGGSGAAAGAVVVRPLEPVQPGSITSDPWADWALAGGSRALRSARDGAPAGIEITASPALAQKLRAMRGNELMLAGAPVVAFRAPDGSVTAQGASGPIRLAARDRSFAAFDSPRATPAPLAVRAGAIPATALAALQLALERTASVGGYRLPMLRITSAPDAVQVGAGLDLPALDPRRTSVRLAGPAAQDQRGAGRQVMELVLSMPFPAGEVHVGNDLSDALQAWLGGTVQPAPTAFPLTAATASFSGLPVLLQRALAQTGDWTAGPGASLPLSVRQVALTGPFDFAAGPAVVTAPPQPRPLLPGEEEIVIPLPLWAQMGRGQLSETSRIMASPRAPAGYAPPMGVYRLVAPFSGPVDLAAGAPAGTPGIVELSGPTTLEALRRPGTSAVQAAPLTGRHLLGRVALDDGETLVGRPGRIRVGSPVAPTLVSGAPDPSLPSAGSAAPSGDAPADSGFVARARAAGERSAADAASALAALRRTSHGAGSSASSGALVAGLPPGAWSGHTRASTFGYQDWSYSPSAADQPRALGGVDLSGLSRPVYPSLPTALRFRYVGAPLWWSQAPLGAAPQPDDALADTALHAGLRTAASAASLWRSMLVAGPAPSAEKLGSVPDGGAAQPGNLSRRLDAQAGSAWVGISRSGSAGALGRNAAARARADSIEMSIVAAIPPAPPPLETMGSLSGGGGAPHARHTRQGHGGDSHGQHQEESDVVSPSKIEGSVDAIAQRIYHRIRRRIQSDRERFGG